MRTAFSVQARPLPAKGLAAATSAATYPISKPGSLADLQTVPVSESPPETVIEGDLLLRRHQVGDVKALHALVNEGVEHIVPWIPWASSEPLSLQQRQEELTRWGSEWESGQAYHYGMWDGDQLVGSCGIYPQAEASRAAIGYWVGAPYLRLGYATAAGTALTTAAFVVPCVERCMIRHDAANEPSGRIAKRLGYQKVRQEPHSIDAPGQTGTSWVWEKAREDWRNN